jgi:hypothetical protein
MISNIRAGQLRLETRRGKQTSHTVAGPMRTLELLTSQICKTNLRHRLPRSCVSVVLGSWFGSNGISFRSVKRASCNFCGPQPVSDLIQYTDEAAEDLTCIAMPRRVTRHLNRVSGVQDGTQWYPWAASSQDENAAVVFLERRPDASILYGHGSIKRQRCKRFQT